MKNRFITYVVPIIILVAAFCVRGSDSQALLTKSFNEINYISINYKGITKTYSIDKNKDLLEKVYESIVNTKVSDTKNPSDFDKQDAAPYFTIEINYNGGQKDLIKGSLMGTFIYRIYDNKGSYIGGENSDLLNLINK